MDGEEAALSRLADPAVLRATLTQVGTSVHPRSDGGVNVHLGPLLKLAGPALVPLLEDLLANDDQLDHELRAALSHALQHEPIAKDGHGSSADAGDPAV